MKDQSKTKQTLIKKKASLDEAGEYAENIINTVREPLIILDQDLRVVTASRSFYEYFKVNPDETEGQLIYNLGNDQWDIPKLRELLETILPQKTTFDNYEVEHNFTSIGKRIMLLNARQIKRALGKERLILLAIEDITERKQLETLLIDSEERYRHLFETASDGIVFLEQREGRITHANPACEKTLGYTKKELIGNKLQDIGVSLDMGDFQTTLQHLNRNGFIYYNDVPVKTKSGQQMDTDIYLVDRATLVQCSIRDITERKKIEIALRESDERYRSLFDRSLDLIYITDFEGRFIDANDAALSRLGYTREEIRSLNLASLLSEDQLPLAFKALQELRETGIQKLLEFRLRHKNGSAVYVETRGSTIISNGAPVAIQAIARDITHRKRVEEALRESEEKFRVLADSTPTAVMLYQGDRWIYANRAAETLSGYSEKELLTMNFWDIVHPDFKPLVQEHGGMRQQGKETNIRYEFKIIAKDGTEKWADLSGASTMIQGRTAGIITVLDITERKLADELLRKSNDQYRTFVKNASDIVFRADETGHFTFVNPVTLRITGYSEEEIIGKHYKILIRPDKFKEVITLLVSQYDKRLQNTYIEFPILTKDGQEIWLGQNTQLIMEDDHVIGFQALARDITERKQVEKVLRESEDKYRLIAENTADLITVTDMNLQFTYISPSITHTHGYTVEEAMGLTLDQFLVPESMQTLLTLFEEEMKLEAAGTADPKRIIIVEVEEYKKDGSLIWLECSISVQRDKENKPIRILTVSRDITQRKQVENALRKNEEKYRTILESIQEGYYEIDLAGNLTFFNDSLCRIIGYPKEELMGMNYRQYEDKESLEKVFQTYNKVYETGDPLEGFDRQIIRKDGTKTYAESSVSLQKDSSGKPIGFRGLVRDVTDRKQTGEKLLQTLATLRKAFGTTIQVLISALEVRDPYTAGHQKRVSDLARAIATEMGLDKDKIEGIRMAGSIHDIGKLAIPSEILTKPTKLTNIEFSLIKEHSQSGYEMLKDVESPWPLAQIVYQHHERIDGSGYPRKLKGDEIIIEARIMAVADVVEAMASHRPYRPGLGLEAALEEIEKNKGVIYDDAVAEACLKLFREKGYQLT